ncbi:MAG: YceD family protein [Candidatus Izemoplasma sp.]|nr:YceD family protein [Candidatus Izemoplasma sp.]
MKWTIAELMKQYNIDNTIDETIDLTDYIAGTDILDISDVHVTGDFEIYDGEEFNFLLEIDCTLTLQCAITLKEIEYPMHFEVEEVLTTYEDDETRKINGITIDLLPIIWSNIYLEKPMRVVSDNAYDEVDFENDEIPSSDETINKAFASLKNNKN